MKPESRYAPLFEPLQIGPKTLRNRFYKVAHCTHFGVTQPGAQAELRAVAAEGGWAACSTEACSIHPSSDSQPLGAAALWDDNDIRNLALMCDRVHEYGSLAGVELWYGGPTASTRGSRMYARGVSQISEIGRSQSCYEVDNADIRELQSFYVEAAKRARTAGFDIINVYAGQMHPITLQFLEPFYNRRTDEYGGSFENRVRFLRETTEAVKEAVGDDCAITIRLCLDSMLGDMGLDVAEFGAIVELLDHLVDLWDFTLGAPIEEWGEDSLASRFGAENYEAPLLREMRPHTDKPIVGVGRFVNPDIMLEMVTNGPLDLIGSARGSISDPFLPKKIQEGRLDEIRECIGCNICVSNVALLVGLMCAQNATAGEEYRRGWHPEKFSAATNASDDVLVIGAGPAGMECAIVLAKRGMRRIHLVDSSSELGGTMRWIPQLPGLGEWARLVNYRKIQIDKLKNIEFIPNTSFDADGVIDYGAELVVVATGSYWSTDGLNGASRGPIVGADANEPWCFTPEQIMVDGKKIVGDKVLLYDCDGYFMAVGLAEKLARQGKTVTLVTPENMIGRYTFLTGEGWRINRMMHELGVELITQHAISEISQGEVTGHHVFHPGHPRTWRPDSVVLVTQRVSRAELYRDLNTRTPGLNDAGIKGVYRIGDCVVPRLVADAVFAGHRLGREIDSGHPADPLPYIREHRVLGAADKDYAATLQVVRG